MNILRIFLLFLYAAIATRLISETNSCSFTISDNCVNGYMMLVPFLISTYFCDFLINYFTLNKILKKDFLMVLAASPYILFTVLSFTLFISTSNLPSVEYILNKYIFFSLIFYFLTYYINKLKFIYKFNFALMVSFMLAFGIFFLI